MKKREVEPEVIVNGEVETRRERVVAGLIAAGSIVFVRRRMNGLR